MQIPSGLRTTVWETVLKNNTKKCTDSNNFIIYLTSLPNIQCWGVTLFRLQFTVTTFFFKKFDSPLIKFYFR